MRYDDQKLQSFDRNKRALARRERFDADIFFFMTASNNIATLSILGKGPVFTTSSGAQGFNGARRGTMSAFFAVASLVLILN